MEIPEVPEQKVFDYITYVPTRKPEFKAHSSLGSAKNAFSVEDSYHRPGITPWWGVLALRHGVIYKRTEEGNVPLYVIPEPDLNNPQAERRPWKLGK